MPAKQILESTGTLVLVYRLAAISVRVILKELKRRMEPERQRQVFPPTMAESTIARCNATVAGRSFATACTLRLLPSPFLTSANYQLPFEWPVARLSIEFASIAASFSQNVSRLAGDSISSFVVIQRQKQNANRLPMQNVKVYFPCLPNLYVPDLSTPLTRKVFTAGLFDATTTSNLGASFGQTKVRLEVRSASPEQYEGDFNEKEWHKYMPTPWDVMQLCPAQALTISCQSCGVQIASGDLRDTYGRSFVVKSLDKIKRDCCNLFPQDNKRINLPRLASIFEEPGFVTPDAPQHQFGAHREHCPAHQSLEQLDECGIDPLNLALQVFKP